MGGSIKKGQIGHFIVSIAKSLEQKENNTANMAILKSRFGKDGIVFEDIKFDNGTIQIDMGKRNNNNGVTFGDMRNGNKQKAQSKLNALMDAGLKSREDNF